MKNLFVTLLALVVLSPAPAMAWDAEMHSQLASVESGPSGFDRGRDEMPVVFDALFRAISFPFTLTNMMLVGVFGTRDDAVDAARANYEHFTEPLGRPSR